MWCLAILVVSSVIDCVKAGMNKKCVRAIALSVIEYSIPLYLRFEMRKELTFEKRMI